jgi:hypothetical protein
MSYLLCKHKSHSTFMTALTPEINSLNDGGFSNVSTCGLIPSNSNCSLTNPPKCKRITWSIYIFTVTEVSMNQSMTMNLIGNKIEFLTH